MLIKYILFQVYSWCVLSFFFGYRPGCGCCDLCYTVWVIILPFETIYMLTSIQSPKGAEPSSLWFPAGKPWQPLFCRLLRTVLISVLISNFAPIFTSPVQTEWGTGSELCYLLCRYSSLNFRCCFWDKTFTQTQKKGLKCMVKIECRPEQKRLIIHPMMDFSPSWPLFSSQ